MIFIIEEVVFGPVVQETVFAYDIGIELDSAAFDTFFPAVRAEESMPEPAPAVEPEPAPSPPQVEPEPPVNRGGRPTDRDLVLEEASWRLRHRPIPKTLAAFGRELREWLNDHGEHRAVKTGEVMKAETIEDHVRPMWKAHKRV